MQSTIGKKKVKLKLYNSYVLLRFYNKINLANRKTKISAKAHGKVYRTNMAMNTAEMKKGATKHCSWGTLQIRFTLSRKHTRRHILLGSLKAKKIKGGMTEWEKIIKTSSQRKRKSGCMHVAEKVLKSATLLKIHIFVYCILLVEMVQLKKILTQSTPHCKNVN